VSILVLYVNVFILKSICLPAHSFISGDSGNLTAVSQPLLYQRTGEVIAEKKGEGQMVPNPATRCHSPTRYNIGE